MISEKEIREMAGHFPVISLALETYDLGLCTFEQAMMTAVYQLARQIERLQKPESKATAFS